MIDVGRARARYARALGKRDQIASILDDAYEFTLPLRPRINARRSRPTMERLFDSTAVVSLQNFASRFLQAVLPADQRAFVLRAGPDVPPEERAQVNEALDQVADEIHAALLNSDCRTHAHEVFQDIGIGTGFLRVEAGPVGQPIRYQALAPHEVVPDTGPWGTIDALFLPREVAAGDVTVLWEDATLPPSVAQAATTTPEAKLQLLEVVQRDWSDRGNEAWDYAVLLKDDEAPLVRRRFVGEGSCPLITPRYSIAAGEVWGRGPVMHALPDVKTLNLLTQLVLENADLAISGAWQVEDDGVVNVDNLVIAPGSVIPKAMGSAGLQPLQSGGRFDVASVQGDELRLAIKRALYDEDLGPPTGTPMSATEVLQRTTDRAERVGGPFGRLLQEFLFPLVRRVAYLLREAGKIRLPTIDGRVVEIRPTSPLARAQDNEDLLRHDRLLEMITLRFGQQVVAMKINPDRYIDYAAERIGTRQTIRNTPAEEKAVLERVQAMAQQAAQAGVTA